MTTELKKTYLVVIGTKAEDVIVNGKGRTEHIRALALARKMAKTSLHVAVQKVGRDDGSRSTVARFYNGEQDFTRNW